MLWAIRTRRGRIDPALRYRNPEGKIVTTGCGHLQELLTNEAARWGGPYTGPVWRRKQDAQAWCYPDEEPVPVRIVGEAAEPKAHLKRAIHALQEAWPCDHATHYETEDLRIRRCVGVKVERALDEARSALKALVREEVRARG